MQFIVTETHYEYNDETYNSPDAAHGKEPGVPVAVFNTKAEAEADRWQREIDHWRDNDELGGYVYAISNGEPWSGSRNYQAEMDAYNDKRRRFAEIAGIDPLEVQFGYEFSMPTGLTDAQIREVIEMFEGPHFYNVFEV